jgi:hypothetical protein
MASPTLSSPARGRRERRKSNPFDICAKRRREIVSHARLVGAADSDDFSRWLIAWIWHNSKAADPIWSLMNAARTMGREITEAEAAAIIEEASTTRKHLSADNLARWLGVAYDQRQMLGLTTIGSTNVGKRARKELRKRRWRLNAERRRRGRGMRPQSESLSATQPWKELGMSRRTWYRKNKARTGSGTDSSTPIFLSTEDRPVPTGLAEGSSTLKKASQRRGERRAPAGSAVASEPRLPSSQTAIRMAVDVYETFPVELRLLALGLPLFDDMRMAA